jgi:hypothetical protein
VGVRKSTGFPTDTLPQSVTPNKHARAFLRRGGRYGTYVHKSFSMPRFVPVVWPFPPKSHRLPPLIEADAEKRALGIFDEEN